MQLEYNCDGCSKPGLSGLGWYQWAALAWQIYATDKGKKDGGDDSQQGGAPGTMVHTNVQTNVSPQISPIFIQQDSPRDSPISAGVYGAGAIPRTGSYPGIDSMIQIPDAQPEYVQPLVIGGLALLAVAIGYKIYKSRKRK